MLTQPDQNEEESLEDFVKSWIKIQKGKKGNVFLHCIHRLDRPVSGLVLFAKTSKALSRLNEQSRRREIQRIYIPEVEGFLRVSKARLDHYLIHGDHRAIVAKKEDGDAKHARLVYQTVSHTEHTTVVQIELETGRYHQIRAQFSAIGHPVVGDTRYGGKALKSQEIHLHCASLSFSHPITQEIVSIETPAWFI